MYRVSIEELGRRREETHNYLFGVYSSYTAVIAVHPTASRGNEGGI